jgi:hypothetical protein
MVRINCIKPVYYRQDPSKLDSGLVSVGLKFSKGDGHNNSAATGGEDYLRSIRQFEEFVSQKS